MVYRVLVTSSYSARYLFLVVSFAIFTGIIAAIEFVKTEQAIYLVFAPS